MLAMPLATAGIGFWTTLLMLVGLWAVMSYTALLLVEVYQYNDTDTGLSSLAYKYLGRSGQWLTGLSRSEEHTSELQSRPHLVCRLLLEKKKKANIYNKHI